MQAPVTRTNQSKKQFARFSNIMPTGLNMSILAHLTPRRAMLLRLAALDSLRGGVVVGSGAGEGSSLLLANGRRHLSAAAAAAAAAAKASSASSSGGKEDGSFTSEDEDGFSASSSGSELPPPPPPSAGVTVAAMGMGGKRKRDMCFLFRGFRLLSLSL